MKMTRVHFRMIADILARTRPADYASADEKARWHIVYAEFVNELSRTNDRFDADIFHRKCHGLS